jgi:hypothetical protein
MKQGGLYPGREVARRYDGVSSCVANDCCCCNCTSNDDDGEVAIPRPFDRGVCGNFIALCCPSFSGKPVDAVDANSVVALQR